MCDMPLVPTPRPLLVRTTLLSSSFCLKSFPPINPLPALDFSCPAYKTNPEQFITKKCSDGLGQEKFAKALNLLKQMQEGDCRVVMDGVEYDGNEDDDVRWGGRQTSQRIGMGFYVQRWRMAVPSPPVL